MAVFNFTSAKQALVSYLNSSSATTLHALSPRPDAIDCENPQIEELISSVQGGVMAVDDTGATNTTERASGDNRYQTVKYNFDVYVASTGATREGARAKVRTIISAMLEDLTGAGAFINTNRATVFSCIWTSWEWAATSIDSMVADARVQLVLTIYRSP